MPAKALTIAQAEEVRTLHGRPTKELALQFGVSCGVILKVMSGGYFKGMPPAEGYSRGMHKLTAAKVEEIKRLYGRDLVEIAGLYGISKALVCKIMSGASPKGSTPAPGYVYNKRDAGQFSDEQVREMRRRAALGEDCASIGRAFGASQSVTWRIVNGHMYKRVK